MASICRHKTGGHRVRYLLYYPDGTSVVKLRYAKVRSVADALLREADFLERGSRSGRLQQREISQYVANGLISDAEAIILSGRDGVKAYSLSRVFENWELKNRLANTPVGHAVNLKRAYYLQQWFDRNPIPTLSATDIRRYINDRLSGAIAHVNRKTGGCRVGVAPKTVKNELELIRGIIDEAVALDMVDKNVAREVDVTVKASRLRRSFGKDEVVRLLAAADLNRHMLHGQAYEFIMVALYTGMRRAEIRALEWFDVDFDAMKIRVQAKELPGGEKFTTKSGAADTVAIPDRLLPILEGMDKSKRFVFGGDAPYRFEVITITVKVIIKRAGLPGDLSLHHLRHTFGAWLLKLSGGDLKYVQQAMRHLDLSSTKKYMHVLEEENAPARRLDFGV